MTRAIGVAIAVLVAIWVVAHVLYIGPIVDATELTLTWVFTIVVIGGLAAAAILLLVGMIAGRTNPAWLRFVEIARTAAAIVACALIIVGLLHYRDTEPHGDVTWLVAGVTMLAAAGAVHWWVVRTRRAVFD